MSTSTRYFALMDAKHHGEILRTALTKKGIGPAEFARRIKVTRTTVYRKFEAEKLDFYDMMRYGKLIDYDFSKDIPELSMYRDHLLEVSETSTEFGTNMAKDLEECKKSVQVYKDQAYQISRELSEWKGKYIELMELYTVLKVKEASR